MSILVPIGSMMLIFSVSNLYANEHRLDEIVRQIEILNARDAERARQIEKLVSENEQQKKTIQLLRVHLNDTQAIHQSAPVLNEQDALEHALQSLRAESAENYARSGSIPSKASPAQFRLIDLSVDTLFAVGTSSEPDSTLQTLQGGAHDPKKRGFTLQQVELSAAGVVDPYFRGEAHIIYGVDVDSGNSYFELEEAFVTTTSLPAGMQFKAGHFFTEFGRINPRHPHDWHWLDQPIVNTRLFGGDGMRAPGVRLSWLLPVDWFSQLYLGAQNANGETMYSFLGGESELIEGGQPFETTIGGRPARPHPVTSFDDLVYLTRWENGFDITTTLDFHGGTSGLYGPNNTGRNGKTWIYGADILFKWRPTNRRLVKYVTWQTEWMQRRYDAERFDFAEEGALLKGRTLNDWGFYTQALWGFKRDWSVGLRYEFANAGGENVAFDGDFGSFENLSKASDPFRNERSRISPLMVWQPSEFSRVRAQYNYDHAEHLSGKGAHSFWLGLEFLFGAHHAHKP